MPERQSEPGKTSQGKILGWFFTIAAMVPYLIWIIEMVSHLIWHPHDDYNPMVNPGDIWMLTIPAIAVGIGLAAGYGNEIVDAALDRLKGGTG